MRTVATMLLPGARAETPTGELQPWDVSPGIEGFWAFFVLAAAVAVLGYLMVRQMRRVDQGARLRAAQEVAAARRESEDSRGENSTDGDAGPRPSADGPAADGPGRVDTDGDDQAPPRRPVRED